ncbi:hypothetical protein RJ641_012757, partial [Dillenia turbinata]
KLGSREKNLIFFLTGLLKGTWQPVMTGDTTDPSYWLNRRFLLCSIWIFSNMILASILIWKYEGFNCLRVRRRENQQEKIGALCKDDAWRICFKGVHPGWLLAYRIISFISLLGLLVGNVVVDGSGIFYFYTQWTFTLVTIYFGMGSFFSIYGCWQYRRRGSSSKVDRFYLESERGTYLPPTQRESTSSMFDASKNANINDDSTVCQTAGMWGYIFQVIFQMCAGAVMLTDSVFWLVLYPFLTSKDFSLDFCKDQNNKPGYIFGVNEMVDAEVTWMFSFTMHSVNAVFLLGDTMFNSLRFPLFRMAYFVLLTAIYVIFQWIIHANISMWWPYPFLDLSSPYSPLWYLAVGLMHIPCYGAFALVVRMKHYLFSRSFPGSYQSIR